MYCCMIRSQLANVTRLLPDPLSQARADSMISRQKASMSKFSASSKMLLWINDLFFSDETTKTILEYLPP